jgi:hypothetical protein
VTRDELILRTRQLIAEGERLDAAPSLNALQTWLQLSDDLLSTAWGSMDRYHLSWLMVGKPKDIVRGRPMTPDEEGTYVREVASQKTAALRMSLDAVERQGMPFRGETGGVGPGQGMGEVPADQGAAAGEPPAGEPTASDDATAQPERHAHLALGSRRAIPLGEQMTRRLEEARRAAGEHREHAGDGEGGDHRERGDAQTRRAPRPDRLQR